MNAFETILLDLLGAAMATAPAVLPAVVHSSQGIIIANASEEFAQAFLARLAAPPAPAEPPAASTQNAQQTTGVILNAPTVNVPAS